MSNNRKSDHIDMSFGSVPDHQKRMLGSSYEPLLSAHPQNTDIIKKTFLGFDFGMPLWVSSMTGGTEKAHHINHNLARACGEFQLGMGLGSCRPLLNNNDRLKDFDVKHLMNGAPLFINLGIAQLETVTIDDINALIDKLNADGLVIHVNPLQEWAQKEGDRYTKAPIETITWICENLNHPIIVKEVGQGMGPQSLKALMDLPIAAIELAGYGGTNFSILEMQRGGVDVSDPSAAFGYVGHTAQEMIGFLNDINTDKKSDIEIIISGGVKDPLSGHILMQELHMNSIIGMASNILKYAMQDYDILQRYLCDVQECFAMAQAYIKP
jgi:isopentenyl-diphosphate delta-isomerase